MPKVTIPESPATPTVVAESPYYVKSCGPLKSSVGSYVSIAGATTPIDTSNPFFAGLKSLSRADDKFLAFPGQPLPSCFSKGTVVPVEVFKLLTK